MEEIMSNSLSMCFIYKPMGAILWKLFSKVGFARSVAQGLCIKEKFAFFMLIYYQVCCGCYNSYSPDFDS